MQLRVTFLFSIAAAVIGSCGGVTPPNNDGKEGGPCYPNSTCDPGLTCLSDLCVDTGDGLDAGGPDGPEPGPDATIDATSGADAEIDGPIPDASSPDSQVDASGPGSPESDSTLLCFDGFFDYGRTVPMASAVSTLTGATVEFWFRSSNPTGERQFFVFHGNDLGAARGVALSIADASAQNFTMLSGRVLHLAVDARDNGGNLNARGFDIDEAIPGFSETQWHHYAIVFTAATQRAFVDGIELTMAQQRDGSADTSFANAFGAGFATTLDIGWFPRDGIRYLAGSVEDFRVSSVARYGGTFTPMYPLTADASTVAFYGIDEGSGSTSTDIAGGYTVTWFGATWNSCTTFAVSFDGSNDVLSSSTPLGFGTTSNFTAEFWFRPTSIGPWMKLLNVHNAADRDVDMELRPDGRVYCTLYDQTGMNHGSTSTSTLVAGNWYHIACSYDGTTQRTFINGVLETSTVWPGLIRLDDIVSVSGFEGRYIAGVLDEFRLSSNARYTSTFTPSPHLGADATSLVLWTFDEGSGGVSADLSGHGHAAVLGVGPGAGDPPTWVPSDR